MPRLLILVALAALIGCQSKQEQFLEESAVLDRLKQTWLDAKLGIKDQEKQEERLAYFVENKLPFEFEGKTSTPEELAAERDAVRQARAKAEKELEALTAQLQDQQARVDSLQKAL